MNAVSHVDAAQREFHTAQAIDNALRSVDPNNPFFAVYRGLLTQGGEAWSKSVTDAGHRSLQISNAIAKTFRENTRAKKFMPTKELVKSGAISKAQLDVGTLTNFANITGGQTLGYVSLDTQMARGTVRPNSFTLYQALKKSAAFQVVDYWPTAQETGGGLPGTAFKGFSDVATGSLATSAGIYNLSNITLKLAVNGRSITTALAAQNSFVDVTAQENINAALTVLESVNWTSYWGNSTIFTNQFNGLQQTIANSTTASGNIFNYQTYYNNYATGQGWGAAQTMFNLIYESSAKITGYKQNGRITHAFMSPTCAASLQTLVTTLLNNVVAGTGGNNGLQGIIVDGDLQGMKTRFGEIQFPVDLFITARDRPAQAIFNSDGTNAATVTTPTKPVSVTAAVVTGTAAAGTLWTTSYTATSGIYSYAVASLDTAMNESTLCYIASGGAGGSTLAISGVGTTTAYQLTITPPGAADATAFRIYRSGLGYAPTTGNPASYRYIGVVAANGASAVTYTDLNAYIPSSETVFLLDMDENDNAVDYRFLLPLTKIELFAANLFMPWAVASIGALRVRIPKFNGLITNFVGQNPEWNPLSTNSTAV